jgi:hypothetical protein
MRSIAGIVSEAIERKTMARPHLKKEAVDIRTITVRIAGVRFMDDRVYFTLTDDREVSLPLNHKYLRWLKNASPEQRANWKLDQDGWTVLWPDLDEGVEIEHLLLPKPF